MAIFHFKHSYLNRRVFSWLLFRADRIFQVHDMTINFFLFFFSIFLLRATIPAIDGPPSWNISSQCEDCFGRLASWSKIVYITSVQRKNMAQKCSREMGNFGQHASRHQSGWFQNITILGTCFCSLKRFGRFETVASLDAYQITNCQFF